MQHHHHHHPHHAPAPAGGLLTVGAMRRVAVAVALVAGLWLAVWWALS